MSRIAIEGSDYAGRTRGLPWQLPHALLSCRRFGSSLNGRRKHVRWAEVGRTTYQVERFVCRCGACRQVPREVAAG
jgi:hypothetical protein